MHGNKPPSNAPGEQRYQMHGVQQAHRDPSRKTQPTTWDTPATGPDPNGTVDVLTRTVQTTIGNCRRSTKIQGDRVKGYRG